ncbi:MAG: hypothetical protein ACKVJE_05040 [Pseudomonadales bacterium]|jgi:hypothetical protein
MDLNTETEKLNVLRAENESAQPDYNSQRERDSVREDGSGRQDALHERFLRESRDRANAAFVAQEKVVSELSAG